MAFGSRKIEVEIVGDSRSLERAFSRSSRAGKQWQRDMTLVLGGKGGAASLARSNVIGAAALAAGAAFVKTTQAASSLNEQMTRSKQVFGSAGESVQAWSKTLAQSFGLAQTEALQAASNFGQMFRTIGLGTADAAQMSRRLVELAADLASFNDEDPSEMLDRLRSGLAGEAEPLRRFGILLSEARVKSEAYATGIAKVGAKLTEQQKVQARYSLILKDTALAQGDFARTSDSLANKQRQLNAALANLEVTIGTKLLPAMTDLVTAANEAVTGISNLGTALEGIDGFVAKVGIDVSVTGTVKGALKGLIPGLGPIDSALDALRKGGAANRARQAALDAAEGIRDRPEPWELAGRFAPTPAQVRKAKASAELRNQWFDAMIGRRIDRVQDIRSIAGQIAELRRISALIEDRIRITKDQTRLLTLEDQQLSIQREILALQAQHAEAARAAAKDRREAERERKETELFALLGLGPGGAARTPGVAALRKRFEKTADALRGTKFEAKFRQKMQGIARALTDPLLKAFPEVRRVIEQELAKIDALLGGQKRKRKPAFRHVNTDELLRGLGLSPDQIRALRGRLAATAGGKVPAGGRAAFGMALGGATVVNVYGDVVTPNPDAFARQMQKRGKRNTAQQRGVRPGVNQGMA